MKRLAQILKLYLIFLLLFEFSRLYFILYNNHLFGESLAMVFIKTAWHGFRLDLSTAAYCMIPFFLVLIAEHIFRRKSNPLIFKSIVLLEFFIILMITIADPELYLQWGSKFNNQVLVYMSHPKEMILSAGAFNHLRTALFLLCYLPLLYLFLRRTFKILKTEYAYSWQYLLVILFFTALNFLFLRGGTGVATISQASAIHSTSQAVNAAAINSLWNALYYVVNDTRSLYGDKHLFIENERAEFLFSEQIKPASDSFTLSEIERPNVLIVVLESFTASGSKSLTGYSDCTPNLDRIAKENFSFARCYASGDRTDKGLVSINSGYPAQPVSSIIIFPDKVAKLPGLSKTLKKASYYNSFIYGGDAEYASMKSYLTQQSFDRIMDKSSFPSTYLNSKWGLHDERLFNQAMKVLDDSPQPFYSMALTLSSHEPFDVPYQSDDLKKDDWYGFKNSLRYADHCLSLFLESCKKKPWYKNTLIILVADHGHDLGLDNIYYFGKEKFHIPLIVCGDALRPGLKGVRIDNVVSQTIIPSLLLNTMKIKTDEFGWQSGIFDTNGFAQYHFSNGFGRISNSSEFIYDNNGSSGYFRGKESEKEEMKFNGRVFQQVLIEDFLKK